MSDGFWKILALRGLSGGGSDPSDTQEKTVALSMSGGNQIIAPDDGKTLSKVTVVKPSTLVAGNIKSGIDIGGIVGTLQERLPEQSKTITVTTNGTQEVNPDSGNVLSKVTVTTNVPATPTEEKSVDLAMASGDQVVTPTAGKDLSKVTVKKPATLIPTNIRSGVNIGGVEGNLLPEAHETQAKTVDLAMSTGNQTITPDSGKVLTSVTVNKPATLVESNIKKDVNIGGVVGSLETPLLQDSKSVTITSNGTTTITPDAPHDAMKSVSVTVNVGSERYKTPAVVTITTSDVLTMSVAYINTNKQLIYDTETATTLTLNTFVGEIVSLNLIMNSDITGTGITFIDGRTSYSFLQNEVPAFIVTAANATINISYRSGGGSAP